MDYAAFEKICKENGTAPTAITRKLGLQKGNAKAYERLTVDVKKTADKPESLSAVFFYLVLLLLSFSCLSTCISLSGSGTPMRPPFSNSDIPSLLM